MNEKNKYDNSCHIPNEETIIAMEETEKIILGNICTKKYSSVEELFEARRPKDAAEIARSAGEEKLIIKVSVNYQFLFCYNLLPPHSTTTKPSLIGVVNFCSGTSIYSFKGLNVIRTLIRLSGSVEKCSGIISFISSIVANLI